MRADRMQPVEVTARFSAQGEITPLAFRRGERTVRLASSGRRWEAQGRRHILAMGVDERVYELIYDPAQGLWFVRTPASGPPQVV